MLQDYPVVATLDQAYGGQPGALSAVVVDTTGQVVATIPTFHEVGSNSGEYEATVTLDRALSARIRYTWLGTPALPTGLPPDPKLPTGLEPDTFYGYPVTVYAGPAYAGQAGALTARAVDTDGTLLTAIGPFTEVPAGSGNYEANPQFNSSWGGLIRYTWTGTPAAGTLAPDTFAPATAAGSSQTTLTSTDLDNVEARVVAAVGQRNIWLFPVLAQFLPTAEPVAPHVLMPPLVPGTDRTLLFAKGDLPEGTRLLFATLGLRVGSNMIGGLADLVVTPTLSEEGQITNPGVETGKGTTAVSVLFILPNAKTAFVAPGSVLRYFVTVSDASSPAKVYELEQGSWAALTDGPRG